MVEEKTRRLTKHNHPVIGRTVWMWRSKERHWIVVRWDSGSQTALEADLSPYSHWQRLSEPAPPPLEK